MTTLQNIVARKLLKYYYKISALLILINTEKLRGLLVKGFGNVNIRSELLDFVKLMIKSKDVPHTQIAAVVQDAMVDYLTKNGYYPTTPRFENIVVEQQKIVLKDLKHKIMAVVTLGNRGPYCEYDKSIDCDHIKFVKVMPYMKAQKKRRSRNTDKTKPRNLS